MITLKDRFLVTAALPYANGRLHVGQIAGAYLPADTFVRFLRLTGREAVFVCGSDENGVPITLSAMKEGVTPQEIVDRYHAINAKGFAGLDIEFSIYGRTHSARHDRVSQDFFLRLHEDGHVQKRKDKQVFCATCQMFLPDRYIEGTCHHAGCRKPGARGDQCEACGRPIDATLLDSPECMICRNQGGGRKGELAVRETEHWYLRLDTFERDLRRYIDSHPEWREPVRRFSRGLLDEGLRERCITRDLDWGVPVPLPGLVGKVLYVWFDAPIGYITFTREYFEARGEPDAWLDFWQDDSTGLIHFIGKDNTVFHAVMFPGMMMAHGGLRMPDSVVANEFLNLENEKISTSRNHAVWVDEYLEHFPADPLRYYLTAIAPELSDSNFSWKEFQARNNGELADNLGNFIQRNLGFCAKYFDGKVPAPGETSAAQAAMLQEIENARVEIADCIADFRFKAGMERLMRLSQRGNQFFAEETPWQTRKTDMASCAATLNTGLRVVEALGVFMAPYLPRAAGALRTMLGLPGLQAADWQTPTQLFPGHPLGQPEVLFPKIDDDAIAPRIEELEAQSRAAKTGER